MKSISVKKVFDTKTNIDIDESLRFDKSLRQQVEHELAQ